MFKKLISVSRFFVRSYYQPVKGALDLPPAETAASGSIGILGWAYSPVGEIESIKIYLDNTYIGDAIYGLVRVDVPRILKNIPTANVGYSFDLPLPLNGISDGDSEYVDITIAITDTTGNTLWLDRKLRIEPEEVEEPEGPDPPVANDELVPEMPGEYEIWIARNELSLAELARQREGAGQLSYRPLFSVIMPVYNPPPDVLKAAIQSVLDQTYDRWELCIADGASPNPAVRAVLTEAAESGAPIHVRFLHNNLGISENSNAALGLAQGDFIVLLDHDDTIAPEALYENALLLNRHPDADMIYSDEDKIDIAGVRSGPFFKPDWSPDLMRSMMYTCHLGVYRTELVRTLNGFDSAYDGAQDYDLVLRLTEKTGKIHHIPKVLYHWRMIEGSTALNSDQKPAAYAKQPLLVAEHCRRIGWECEVTTPSFSHIMRCRPVSNAEPSVTIIIPTRDQPHVLERCVDSILKKSTYDAYDILIVNNDSQQVETHALFDCLRANLRITILDCPGAFNYSGINNRAVAKAKGEFVLLLNDDTEVITPDWIEALLDYGTRSDVGAVGAKLLYPWGTIQHGGVVVGVADVAGHAHRNTPEFEPGYAGRAIAVQNFSAVTGACLLTRRDLYQKVGGLDEVNLPISYNDVDYCLRLRESGYLIVWTPYALLLHHESLSRGHDGAPERVIRFGHESGYMRRRWGKALLHDPYYNPNFSTTSDNFELGRFSPLSGNV